MVQVNYIIGTPGRYPGDGDWYYRPNSAGGVSIRMSIKNVGSKTIKYYIVEFEPYNAVGDKVCCSIGKHSNYVAKGTGPLEQNRTTTVIAKNAWYNPTIKTLKIVQVGVEYMDGTSEIIPGSQITDIQRNTGSGGCFVATAVYGSYDCPQVWTLRRFRDYELAKTWYGRAFIHIYYAISPTIVKWFGNTTWFKKMWKGTLDRMVSSLNKKGVANTPYKDRKW